jgi:glycosyltransferase involved in cell wall biosynthesis
MEMPGITLSMIVKNEEKYLQECFESVKDIIDEIVLVDTGSTDKTLEIAQKYNAKIFHFDWINDFSAARNYALENSTGSWILYLDADERIDPNSVNEIKRITENPRKSAFYCTVKSINPEYGDNSMRYIRLFANIPGIKFTGKIHEQIQPSLVKNDYLLVNSIIQINHIGYDVSPAERKLKAERNLSILLKEYETSKSPYYAFQLGNSYNILNDIENSKKYFLIAGQSSELERSHRAFCFTSLALIAHQNHKTSEAEKLIYQSLKVSDKQPYAHYLASKICLRKGDLDRAEEICKRVLNMVLNPSAGKDESAISILLNKEEVIYYGLTLSLQNENISYTKHYQNELQNYYKGIYHNYNQMCSIVQKLIQNSILSEPEIELLCRVINKSNINFFLTAVYKSSHIKYKCGILEKLYELNTENDEIRKYLSKALDEAARTDDAIEILTKDMDHFKNDPAVYFYLTSFYLKKGAIEKVFETIKYLETNFTQIPEVVQSTKLLKEKINSIYNSLV